MERLFWNSTGPGEYQATLWFYIGKDQFVAVLYLKAVEKNGHNIWQYRYEDLNGEVIGFDLDKIGAANSAVDAVGEPPREHIFCGEPSVSEHRSFPRATGISRLADNDRALLISFARKPSDDELRDIHEHLQAGNA